MHPITAFVIGSFLAITAFQVGPPNTLPLFHQVVTSLLCGIGLAFVESTDPKR